MSAFAATPEGETLSYSASLFAAATITEIYVQSTVYMHERNNVQQDAPAAGNI